MLHWVVQNNLYEERGYDTLAETIERFELPHTFVKVVPFSHELIPAVTVPGPKIIMGSITLARLATEAGWQPGSYINDRFDYRCWRDRLDGYLLNPDMCVCRFGDVAPEHDHFFIRPVLDDKSFAGTVMGRDEFTDWQRRVLELHETYTTLDADTVVCHGAPQQIYWEGRFWVVDGTVVTQSQYKTGRRVTYQQDVVPAALSFAQEMVELWQPAKAFVIDVADTPDGYKVIELGCLNSAGFYASDVQRLVLALQEMEDG